MTRDKKSNGKEAHDRNPLAQPESARSGIVDLVEDARGLVNSCTNGLTLDSYEIDAASLFNEPLLELDSNRLDEGDVLYARTIKGTVYEFIVVDKRGDHVFIECTKGRDDLVGKSGYLTEGMIRQHEPIHFGLNNCTTILEEFGVKKAVEEQNELTNPEIIRGFVYNTPLVDLDPNDLMRGDVLHLATYSGSVYEFEIIKRDARGTYIKCISGSPTLIGKEGYIACRMIQKDGMFFFDIGQTSPLKKVEVRQPADDEVKTMISQDMPKEGALEYDKPLESLKIDNLNVDDILCVETASGSIYQFKAVKRSVKGVYVECIRGSALLGREGYVANDMMRIGEQFVFSADEVFSEGTEPLANRTSPLKEFYVIKSSAKGSIAEKLKTSNVFAIGDSNGSFDTYVSNLRRTGLISRSREWVGGSRKAVIHGDILADRKTDGFKILEKNRALREQARKQGGDIVTIAGNHEDFMFSFLLNRQGVHGDGVMISIMGEQGKGLAELARFSGNGGVIESSLNAYNEGRLDRDEILENMRNIPYGLMLLNEMCEMKLCEQINDTIYLHTDPTDGILEAILEKGVEGINEEFQMALRQTLLSGQDFDMSKNALFDTFLHTSNRTFVNAGMTGRVAISSHLLDEFRSRNIKRFVFGHSDLGRGNRVVEVEGVEFVNVDQGALKPGNEDKVSAAAIPQGDDGIVLTGTTFGLKGDLPE